MSKPALDLHTHLEPIIRLSDHAVVARELLLRPAGGGDLVERAAEADVDMAHVTAFALQSAGVVLDGATVPLHVNVTPADLARASFPDEVSELLTPSELALLVLEVTEQSRLVPSDQLEASLLALRRRGVRFAIDDYGDGWADLASVETVKPEIIKVRLPRLHAETSTRHLAAALLSVADRTHAHVVVECVETQDDLDEVRALGFTHAQGWFWEPPARPAAHDAPSRTLRSGG